MSHRNQDVTSSSLVLATARGPLLPLLALGLLSVALYWPLTGYGFLNFDDPVYVTANPVVRSGLSGEGLRWSFEIGRGHASNWHPLTWMSHMLDVELFGLDAGWHHAVNLLLHTANGLLLYLLLGRLLARGGRPGREQRWACLVVAAVFLVHPQRLESVAWISERKDVLSGLLFMGTLLAHVAYVSRRSVGRYLTVLVLFALGLMAKPMLVTLPAILLLVDAWLYADRRAERPPWSRLVLEKLPLMALSLASAWVTLLAQGADRSFSSLRDVALPGRIANALDATVAYLTALVWPTGLAVHYPFPVDGLPARRVLGAVLVLGSITLLALLAARRRPWFLLGWLWYTIMLVPVIGLVQVGMQSHADRYTYLPTIGVVAAACWGLVLATRKVPLAGPLRLAVGGIVVAALALAARHQLGYWKDDLTLFERACAVSPTSPAAHQSLAIEYAKLGRTDEAIAHDREALRHYPDFPRAHNHLGTLLAARGEYEEGVEHIRTALRLNPGFAWARYCLGAAQLDAQRLPQAIETFRRALAQDPDLAVAHASLGLALERTGEPDQALAAYRRAVSLEPTLFEAQLWLGTLLHRRRQMGQAVAPLEAATGLRPDDPRPHVLLGLIDLERGDIDSARTRQRRLEEIAPRRAAWLAERIERGR